MTHGIVTPGETFGERAAVAVADAELQRALGNLDVRLHTARRVAETSPELKDRAAVLRRETLGDLDGWLDRLESSLVAVGATVHRADTPAAARRIVLDLARREGVRRVVKSKSMATEEIDLGDALSAAAIEAVETDLGEYIVQVAGERPSHMITPAIHKTLGQIATVLGARANGSLPVDREALTAWTHDHLRPAFLVADMGISGVNFAAADTGTITIVTNEGNGRLCTSWPRIHVALMPIDKVIARFVDLAGLLPLLTRSATGQALSNYVSMITGPRRDGEQDGPEQLHVVFLDHNRRALLGTPYEDMLACIRCGACLNVCPVYRKVSGHAYDSVYTGPMGKVLTPLLSAGVEGRDLPAGSTLCGACTEACPVEIPLADLLVRLRADLRRPGPLVPRPAEPTPARAGAGAGLREDLVGGDARRSSSARRPGEGYDSGPSRASVASGGAPWRAHRLLFEAWARAWSSPRGYQATTGAARRASRLGGRLTGRRAGPYRGWARRIPALAGWTRTRDAPLPATRSFRRALGHAPDGWLVMAPATRDGSAGSCADAFADALRANACGVHGPYEAARAAEVAVELAASTDGPGPVAVSTADPLVEALGVVARLAAAGVEVLAPDDPRWRARLPEARAGLTGARVGVAETGTLVLVAGRGGPRAVSLLPPVHVCLVATGDLVTTFAEAVELIAAGPLPSAITWIGGPSRTGDLEMVITMGVHGPRRMEVVLVGR